MESIRAGLSKVHYYGFGTGPADTVDTIFQQSPVQKMMESKVGRVALSVCAGFTCVTGCVIGLAGFTAMLLPIDLIALAPDPVNPVIAACAVPFAVVVIGGLVASIGARVLLEFKQDPVEKLKALRLYCDISTATLSPILPGMALARGGWIALQKVWTS